PTFTAGHPLQLLVTNLSANDYVGRMAVGRIWNGAIRMGLRVTVIREEADDTAGSVEPGRQTVLTGTVTSLTTAHGIERVDIAEARAGDIVEVAGLRSEEHTSELQSRENLVCRLLLEKKKKQHTLPEQI